MSKIYWILLTLLTGAILPIQAGLNSRLGKAAESPVYASLISFLIGSLAILLYITLTKQTLSWEGLKTAPATAWLGGILGAFYVTFIIFAFRELGPGLTFGLVVAGQMLISILLEHYNVLVIQAQQITFPRIIGVIMIIVGVIIIRKY